MRSLGVSVVGTAALTRGDIEGALAQLKRKLMERNVAEEIAEKCACHDIQGLRSGVADLECMTARAGNHIPLGSLKQGASCSTTKVSGVKRPGRTDPTLLGSCSCALCAIGLVRVSNM